MCKTFYGLEQPKGWVHRSSLSAAGWLWAIKQDRIETKNNHSVIRCWLLWLRLISLNPGMDGFKSGEEQNGLSAPCGDINGLFMVNISSRTSQFIVPLCREGVVLQLDEMSAKTNYLPITGSVLSLKWTHKRSFASN